MKKTCPENSRKTKCQTQNWQEPDMSLCLRQLSSHFIQIYVQLKYLETKMQKFSSTVAFQLENAVQSDEDRRTPKILKFSQD